MGRVNYNRGDGIIEIIVRDETGKKTDHFKMNLQDIKQQRKAARMLFEKYGILLRPADLEEGKDGFFDF